MGNAMLCSTGNNGALIQLVNPGNCHEKLREYNKENSVVQTVAIIPYFERTTSPAFDIYTCSEESTNMRTFMSFFGYKSILSKKLVYTSIPVEDCLKFIKGIKEGNTDFKQLAPTVWEKDINSKVRYVYCCREVGSHTHRYIVTKGAATIQYKTSKLISSLFSSTDCAARNGNCTTMELTAIWELSPDDGCHLVRGRVGLGQKGGNFIFSQEMTLAVQLSSNTKQPLCEGRINAYPTKEGIHVILVDVNSDSYDTLFVLPDGRPTNRNPVAENALAKLGLGLTHMKNIIPTARAEDYYKWQRVMYDRIGERALGTLANETLTTNILGLISFVYMSSRHTAMQLFMQNWYDICNIQVTRYHLYINLQHITPTAIARSILHTQRITAKSAGSGGLLQVFACTDIDHFWKREIPGVTFCYETMPISYKFNNKTIDAFLDVSSMTIVAEAKSKPCAGVTSVMALDQTSNNHESVLVWTGKELRRETRNIFQIHTLSKIPLIKRVDLMSGNIYEKTAEALESYMQVAQSIMSVQTIAQMLTSRVVSEDVVQDMSVNTKHLDSFGSEVKNIFSHISDTLFNWTIPDWETILLVIGSILLAFLVICCICCAPCKMMDCLQRIHDYLNDIWCIAQLSNRRNNHTTNRSANYTLTDTDDIEMHITSSPSLLPPPYPSVTSLPVA